jgi:hypothetical protein
VEIEEAESLQPFQIGDEGQEIGEPARSLDVTPVGGKVLGD